MPSDSDLLGYILTGFTAVCCSLWVWLKYHPRVVRRFKHFLIRNYHFILGFTRIQSVSILDAGDDDDAPLAPRRSDDPSEADNRTAGQGPATTAGGRPSVRDVDTSGGEATPVRAEAPGPGTDSDYSASQPSSQRPLLGGGAGGAGGGADAEGVGEVGGEAGAGGPEGPDPLLELDELRQSIRMMRESFNDLPAAAVAMPHVTLARAAQGLPPPEALPPPLYPYTTAELGSLSPYFKSGLLDKEQHFASTPPPRGPQRLSFSSPRLLHPPAPSARSPTATSPNLAGPRASAHSPATPPPPQLPSQDESFLGPAVTTPRATVRGVPSLSSPGRVRALPALDPPPPSPQRVGPPARAPPSGSSPLGKGPRASVGGAQPARIRLNSGRKGAPAATEHSGAGDGEGSSAAGYVPGGEGEGSGRERQRRARPVRGSLPAGSTLSSSAVAGGENFFLRRSTGSRKPTPAQPAPDASDCRMEGPAQDLGGSPEQAAGPSGAEPTNHYAIDLLDSTPNHLSPPVAADPANVLLNSLPQLPRLIIPDDTPGMGSPDTPAMSSPTPGSRATPGTALRMSESCQVGASMLMASPSASVSEALHETPASDALVSSGAGPPVGVDDDAESSAAASVESGAPSASDLAASRASDQGAAAGAAAEAGAGTDRAAHRTPAAAPAMAIKVAIPPSPSEPPSPPPVAVHHVPTVPPLGASMPLGESLQLDASMPLKSPFLVPLDDPKMRAPPRYDRLDQSLDAGPGLRGGAPEGPAGPGGSPASSIDGGLQESGTYEIVHEEDMGSSQHETDMRSSQAESEYGVGRSWGGMGLEGWETDRGQERPPEDDGIRVIYTSNNITRMVVQSKPSPPELKRSAVYVSYNGHAAVRRYDDDDSDDGRKGESESEVGDLDLSRSVDLGAYADRTGGPSVDIWRNSGAAGDKLQASTDDPTDEQIQAAQGSLYARGSSGYGAGENSESPEQRGNEPWSGRDEDSPPVSIRSGKNGLTWFIGAE